MSRNNHKKGKAGTIYMTELIYDIWLANVEGLGLHSQLKLMTEFGSSKEIYDADGFPQFAEEHRSVRINQKAVTELLKKDLTTAERMLDDCVKKGIRIISMSDDDYPERLLDIEDPPIVLFAKGSIDSPDRDAAAIVGARKATSYGLWAARGIGEKLAYNGITVISGMATGIDSSAHRGALNAGGKTAAVLGCGVDICYPATNRKMMEEIMESGVVLSEFPPGTPPAAGNFPRRNRIISGMARCLIVAEAGLGSGSLITAEFALEQGREVFAVPGNISSIYSIGTNKLIRDGATPLIRIDDILTELGISRIEDPAKREIMLGTDEKLIYQIVKKQGDISVDHLAATAGRSVSEVRSLVTILEIKGVVETNHGKIFIAN
jgi:DNA processing protein